jgi:hypothetical protein
MPNQPLDLALGLFVVILGCSFAYKFVVASVLGRCSYWAGFLPITMISPWLVHLPASSKRSLTHQAQGLWVHLIMGPSFLICAILCFAAGTEFMGLPGISTLNLILAGGNTGRPSAVAFDRHSGFRFPFLQRSSQTFGHRVAKVQLGVDADKKMLPDQIPSMGQTMDEARSHQY